jgi:hypothetical protein
MRIQITLEKHDYELARKGVRALGISIAEFVRRTIRDKLPVGGRSPWMRFAGLVESGDIESSRSIDEIVYGTKE